MKILAVCPNDHVYPSGLEMEDSEVTLMDANIQCPMCGKMGKIPSGMYTVVNEVLRYVRAEGITDDDLRILKEHLEFARNNNYTKEQLADRLASSPQKFKSIIEKFPATNFIAFLTLLVTALGVYDQHTKPDTPKIVNQINIVNNYNLQSEEAIKTGRPPGKKKLRGHDRCDCGSGKLYKNCHQAKDRRR